MVMIYELAELVVKEGTGAAFEAAVQQGVPLFQRAQGCLSMRLDRVMERANTYHLVVGWATLENHTVDFRGSADFQTWRGLISEFLAGAPTVEHTDNVIKGFTA
jgi:heme-degrading monooxygenase HmoA